MQEIDGEIVRHDHSVESPAVAQDAGEIARVGRDGHPVDVDVGVHDAAGTALVDRHLERREQHVLDLAQACAHGGMVASGLRGGVSDEVLEGRVHALRLQAADIGGAHPADDQGVFGDALVDPTPAGVADHIEHRSQTLMDAEGSHGRADGPTDLLDQLGVEGRAPRQRRREGRRLPRGEARQAFLVHERRNAQSRLLLQSPLLGPQPVSYTHLTLPTNREV